MARVTLEQVTKIYPDGTPAVEAMDLTIDDGEFLVLVGPSGCGKTTALRMVAGLEDISGGTVRIGDRVVNRVPPRDRDIAMVFQNYALYPHLSVADNMGFGLKLRKVNKDEIRRRVEDAARVLGLEELLDRRPRALSGGQRQRVAMGRAIVREPSAFLMDEPLSNLDAKLRVQMRAEIARIQRQLGTTTLYVTHDQTEAMTMADRVAVMKKGVLQQVAPPPELYEQPVNLFVGGFIGSPAMNMAEARLEAEGDALWVRFGSNRLRVPPELLRQRPSLSERTGQRVVLGIRPEDVEDAAHAAQRDEELRIRAEIDLVEHMGAEAYLHFTVDAPPVITEDTRELARDLDAGGSAEIQREDRADFVARVTPHTAAREGEAIELVVDTSRMHFFDLETGQSVR